MAKLVEMTGVKATIRALYRYGTNKAKGAERGVVKAANFLLRESMKIVPVDTGNLRASGRVRKRGSGWNTSATVEYSASYAIYVHEDLMARHKPGKTAKYLEIPARANRLKIQAMIREEIKNA